MKYFVYTPCITSLCLTLVAAVLFLTTELIAEPIKKSEFYLGTENASDHGSKYDHIKAYVFLSHIAQARDQPIRRTHLLDQHFKSLNEKNLDEYIEYMIELKARVELDNRIIRADIFCPVRGAKPVGADFTRINDEAEIAIRANVQSSINRILRDWGLKTYDETITLMNLLGEGIEVNLMDGEAMRKSDLSFDPQLAIDAYCSREGRS